MLVNEVCGKEFVFRAEEAKKSAKEFLDKLIFLLFFYFLFLSRE
jgi:hypothetical protein